MDLPPKRIDFKIAPAMSPMFPRSIPMLPKMLPRPPESCCCGSSSISISCLGDLLVVRVSSTGSSSTSKPARRFISLRMSLRPPLSLCVVLVLEDVEVVFFFDVDEVVDEEEDDDEEEPAFLRISFNTSFSSAFDVLVVVVVDDEVLSPPIFF